MSNTRYRSWGFTPETPANAHSIQWRDDVPGVLTSNASNSYLAFGNGRSYGDSCLNKDGTLLDSRFLNRFISFDEESGLITVEAGVTLSEILQLVIPKGWCLAVSPGTSQVTVGGAIANDVHGKNHHSDGTFGRFVESIRLLRSDGSETECSLASNSDLFRATIGGLGLTGFIATATIRLLKISSSYMDVKYDAFSSLEQFAQLSEQYSGTSRYTVAWLDCAASGDAFGRGVMMSANHCEDDELVEFKSQITKSIPFNFPRGILNRLSIKAFNALYYRLNKRKDGQTHRVSINSFFYPLDSIGDWNRIYGSKGFYQCQFVVPKDQLVVLNDVLDKIVKSGMGSFLAVLKEFGDIESPGMLSFPREGYCLALDFANRGEATEELLRSIEQTIGEVGGAIYPAKDRLSKASSFAQYFPKLPEFKQYVDEKFTSDYWRRVSGR